MHTNKADFTQGSILKKLSLFMLPILVALILQAAYGAVDLLVVGQFGSTAGLSAVSTGSQVLNLVTFLVTQLAMGVTVLIARYLGEQNEKQIGPVLGGAAVVFCMVSAVLFVLLVCFARPIAVVMQAPEEAVELTASYDRICGGGIFFIVAYNLLSAIFRGLGDSRSPLLFVLVLLKGDALATIFSTDAEAVQKGFEYLKGFTPGTIVTAVLFSMVWYFNGNNQTLWVMIQGIVQTLLVRLPLSYCMSIQPDASLAKIGLAAPISTVVGIALNIAFYIYWNRKNADS